MDENLNIDGLENMDFSNLDASSIDPNFMMSPGMIESFGTIGILLNILTLVMYFGTAYGLYLINKKLGEKYAWLSFVPIIQYYNYFNASQKSFVTYLVYPLLAIFVGFLLSFFTFGISILAAFIYFFVMWIKLLHAISLRIGNGAWTTVGFLFVSFIMFPIVGTKMKDQTEKEIFVTENNNPVLANKSENEIEL